jgi:hypothetical protein
MRATCPTHFVHLVVTFTYFLNAVRCNKDTVLLSFYVVMTLLTLTMYSVIAN